MTKNSNKNDKAQEAISVGRVGKNLRESIVDGLGDIGILISALDELNQVDTIEELRGALDDIAYYDDNQDYRTKSLDVLLEEENVDSLEELVEVDLKIYSS